MQRSQADVLLEALADAQELCASYRLRLDAALKRNRELETELSEQDAGPKAPRMEPSDQQVTGSDSPPSDTNLP